ncbi:N-acetylmuramoyl-L-alanine amidase [Streptosporangium sandarakinum]|uniref:N-acetylmuramoyl-L-alanine amidase n=1 Tax=Streptosporangium sandarakinum TaxID=1260955 RepID=A0A852V6X1_9ACTN|nr:peptidoglycan recognition family protein [Streptosporangium sandarakinum]NYF43850.1 hypothetical protein [Streptosporangium sandarakinum]
MRRLTGPAVLAALTLLVPPPPAGASSPAGRQAAFARAALRYGVPESVLLAVSYLESRWDAHDGLPSVSAGYGPMHLVDPSAGAMAAAAATQPAGDAGDTAHPSGDAARESVGDERAAAPRAVPPADTLHRAAELTGLAPAELRRDPSANILGGAALLADHQRRAGGRPGADPAGWYGAVARYSGATDAGTAAAFADEVYATIRSGAARVTDDGERVVLPADPAATPERGPGETGLPAAPASTAPDCPPALACEWLPAAYRRLRKGGHGNHDRYPGTRPIDYIVIHDGESPYDVMTRLVKDPTYVSWHFTLRSSDGHIAQHLRADDVGWHAGNWYFNSRSIGLEHEGYLARGGAWYTEAMYRASARLVRYLARKYDVPLDRAHILGHDNVPGATPATVQGMHEDPGPYWDWDHYFTLLGSPLTGVRGREVSLVSAAAGARPANSARSVMIKPDYAANTSFFSGCAKSGRCRRGSGTVWLHVRPSPASPLVRDIGKHPTGASTYSVYDHAGRASTGQRYAFAGRRGDWTAIWYLGQRAWFYDPAGARRSVPASGPLVTPRPGLASVKVYGRAYPEASAYPPGIPVQQPAPLQYTLPAGQFYSLGLTRRASYLHTGGFSPASHRVIAGRTRYHQIQFGHRVMFVRAEDVTVVPG